MKEQQLVTETFVSLDFLDRLKVLFGRRLKVTVKITVSTKEEIPHYNGFSKISFVSKTSSIFKKDRPDYGYSPIVEKE